MWALLKTCATAILAVAVVVGGYYIGIVVALITGALLVLLLIVFAIGFVSMAIYDIFQTKKEDKAP